MPQAIAGVVALAFFNLGAPLALANAVLLAGPALITTGLALGANLLASSILSRQAAVPAGNNSPDVRASIRQAVPAQRVIYGQTKVGGAVFFLEVKPPWMYIGLLLSSREVSEIVSVYCGDTLVTFRDDRGAATVPYFNGENTRLYRSVRLGTPNQTRDPIIGADFPDIPTTFRQRGISTVVFKCHYGADQDEYIRLWGNVQIPNFLMEVKGAKVYDPRDPTQIMFSDPNDKAEVDAAMATWKWSNTAALVQSDYLIQPYGGRIIPSRVRWDKIAEAADYDETLVGLKGGGFQKRYTIDGMITKNQSRIDMLGAMLTANRGFVTQSEGRVWITSAKPRTPVLSVHDGMLAGGFQYRDAAPKKSLINRVRTRFVAPDREYQTIDGPIRNDDAYLAADGEVLEQTIELPFTNDHRKAQRLGKAYMDQSRLGKTLSLTLTLDHLAKAKEEGIEAGSVIRVWSEIFPQINGLYQVQTAGWAEDFSTLQVALAQYDPAVETSWNPETDEQPFVIIDVDDLT